MPRVIEFYIPNNFRKSVKWVSPEQRGKIIEFAPQIEEIGLAIATRVAPPLKRA